MKALATLIVAAVVTLTGATAEAGRDYFDVPDAVPLSQGTLLVEFTGTLNPNRVLNVRCLDGPEVVVPIVNNEAVIDFSDQSAPGYCQVLFGYFNKSKFHVVESDSFGITAE